MQRLKLIEKVQKRKKELNITIENLAKISGIGTRTLNRFFAKEDVRVILPFPNPSKNRD